MHYKVELDVYCGPLDLLLHLVRRDELTIEGIPVARIADQFVKYLESIARIDIELAGDYLVMAARLTEMKSRALIPRITTEDEDLDPDLLADQSDLIQRLLEYRSFKDLSRKLRDRFEVRKRRFTRSMFPELPREDPKPEAADLEELLAGVTITDLFSAFQRISKEVLLDDVRTVYYDDVPIERHVELVLERIQEKGAFAFSHILPEQARKEYIIGAFLALLELIKLRKIAIDQPDDFGEISIMPPQTVTSEYVEDRPGPSFPFPADLYPPSEGTGLPRFTFAPYRLPKPSRQTARPAGEDPPDSGTFAGLPDVPEPASPPTLDEGQASAPTRSESPEEPGSREAVLHGPDHVALETGIFPPPTGTGWPAFTAPDPPATPPSVKTPTESPSGAGDDNENESQPDVGEHVDPDGPGSL